MRTSTVWPVVALVSMQLLGCASAKKNNLASYPFPEAQEEIHATLDAIIKDVETGNIRGLRDSHLKSAKFTKFGGNDFERMNLDQCNEDEASVVKPMQDIHFEIKDRKIDVFGDVAIMTCYNHFSFRDSGERKQRIARNTLVFLKTTDGWKIVHEHVTPKACFD